MQSFLVVVHDQANELVGQRRPVGSKTRGCAHGRSLTQADVRKRCNLIDPWMLPRIGTQFGLGTRKESRCQLNALPENALPVARVIVAVEPPRAVDVAATRPRHCRVEPRTRAGRRAASLQTHHVEPAHRGMREYPRYRYLGSGYSLILGEHTHTVQPNHMVIGHCRSWYSPHSMRLRFGLGTGTPRRT